MTKKYGNWSPSVLSVDSIRYLWYRLQSLTARIRQIKAMKKYFDLSLLPKAISQFTILSDTHYTISDGIGFHEFASRSKQTKRAATALTMAASLPSDFTVHLGDLVQDFPGTASFTRALKNSMEQIRDRGLKPYFVPGNHDVGDKPDPTMPTHPTEKKT